MNTQLRRERFVSGAVCLIFLGLGCGSAMSAPLSNAQSQPEAVTLSLGQTEVFDFPEASRVVVGDGDILKAKSLGKGKLLLAGSKPGKTSLILLDGDRVARRMAVKVEDHAPARLEESLRSAVGDKADLRVSRVGERLVVSGAVKTASAQAQIDALIGKDPGVVSVVTAESEQQMIAMEVRFLEVKKNALESIGINWQKSMAGPIFGVVGDLKTNNSFRPVTDGSLQEGIPAVSSNFPGLEGAVAGAKVSPFQLYFGLQSTLLSVINLMEKSGDAVVLAEPVLTCKSGGSAKFLAGGEIPLPITNSLGSSTIQFKPYGIRFEVSPTISDGGMISANVTTELSTIDPAVKVGELPGFLSRMTQTEVSLREGETLVLSGLISEEASKGLEKVTGLGDIPLLGALFRSKDFQERRSEMVVFVTPRRIGPNSENNLRAVQEAQRALEKVRRRISGEGETSSSQPQERDQPQGLLEGDLYRD